MKTRKRIFVLIALMLFLILTGCSTTDHSSAGSTTSPTTPLDNIGDSTLSADQLSNGGDTSGQLVGASTQKMLTDAENNANLMNGFIISKANDLFKIPGINSLQNLVFGNPYTTWGFNKDGKDKLIDGIFYQSELDSVIHPLIRTFSGVYATILMVAIMFSSLKMGMKAHSPQSKEDFWKDVHMYVASAFFMGLFWMLFHIMMAINWGIVQGVSGTLTSMGKRLDGPSIIASATNDGSNAFSMGSLLLFFVEWGLALYLNIIYIARKIILVLLCVMSPFAAYSLLFAKTRSFFGIYLKEMAGNIFLPTIHCITLFVFVQIAGNLGVGMGASIFKLGMMVMFVPITGMMSKWLNLGDSSTAVGRTATMMGLAGIGGAMMLSRGAMNMAGKGKAGGSASSVGASSAEGGTETPAGSPTSYGNDSGASVLSRASEGGSVWNKVKKAASVTGAAAGGLVGLPFGGSAAGAAIGSKVATGVLQRSRDISSGMKGIGGVIKNASMNADGSRPEGNFFSKISQGASNIGEKWGDLTERRQMMGNLGEAAGKTAAGVGGLAGMAIGGLPGAAAGAWLGGKVGNYGKSLGQMASGVSRQRAFEHGSGEGSPRGMTPEQLSQDSTYRGKDARWNQTNDRSWYEVEKDGKWQMIGGFGSGDASLKKDQLRRMDYKVGDHNDKWDRQENGSYTMEVPMTNQPYSNGGQSIEPRTQRQVVGMSGSTSSLGRKSEAYMVDRSTDKKLHSDNNFDVRRIDPDDYFNHTAPGKKAGDDKVADFIGNKVYPNIGRAGKVASEGLSRYGQSQLGWSTSGAYNNNADRKRDIV